MSRFVAVLPLVACAVLASTASAAESEPELEKKPLVWLQAYSSVQTIFDAAPRSAPDGDGSLRPGADIGLSVGLGQGKWSADPRVLPGFSGAQGNLEGGYAVGLWMRHSSANPARVEHGNVSFGLAATSFGKTGRGLMLANTFEAGARLSHDDQGRMTSEDTQTLGQVQLGISQQVAIFDSFLLGPAVSVDLPNKSTPWSMATGLRVSSIF
jgi:hypothetical protein